MQCTSFLQGCSSNRDVNAGANNGAWLYNGNMSSTTGYLYNVSLPPPSTDLFVVNDKDLLRRTMLRHDIIFRDQVHELHRLYRRQRELMDEFKMRELSKQKLQLQAPHSNSFLPEISSKSAQCTWQTPGLPWVRLAACKLSPSSSENFQSVSSKWSSSQAGPCTAQDEDGLKEALQLSGPRSEKPRRKMLDLELPADEYINSEEEDHLGEGKLSKVPELPYYPPERMPGILLKKDLKPFPCGVLVNSSSQGISAPDFFSASTINLADLNQSVRSVGTLPSNSANLSGRDTSHKGIQCQDQEMSRIRGVHSVITEPNRPIFPNRTEPPI